MTITTTAAGITPGRPAPGPVLAEQLGALEALIVIGRTFAHLPAVDLQVGTVFPDRISIWVHDSLGDFETWRSALGIPHDAIEHNAYNQRMTLRASTPFHGATVELIGAAPALPTGGERA